jgi:enoyl-CoA hydratase/carnithine racemase
MPGCGGTQRLPALIGLPKSMELIFQDTNASAEEALQLGIVDLVVPNRDIVSCAVELAKYIGDDYKKENIKEYIHKFSSRDDTKSIQAGDAVNGGTNRNNVIINTI